MQIAIKVVVGLIGLLLAFMGINLMFIDPAAAAGGFNVTPIGPDGLNTLRGDLGGMFVTGGVLLALGIVQQKAQWFYAVAILMGLIALGRLVGFVVDGGPGDATLPAFISELVFVAILSFAGMKIVPANAS